MTAKAKSKAPRIVTHINLVMVRVATEGHMEEILTRATLRSRLVLRLASNTALFQRSALPGIKKRLGELEVPVVLSNGSGAPC